MSKRVIAVFLTMVLILATATGCAKHATKKTESAVDLAAAEKYAIVTTSSAKAYEKREIEGFTEIMEEAGKEYIVCEPENGTVAEQETFIKELIEQQVSCIAISASDADALKDLLKEALDSGIDVCSFDKPADPTTRELFVNQTGTTQVAVTLMDAVLDLCGGSGSWTIISSTSTASSQNIWIDEMKDTMKDEKYENLTMEEIAYGDDNYQKIYNQTMSLIQNHPDMKVICVVAPESMQAAADALTAAGSDVKLTGFGLPSEMTEYVGTDKCCPYFYLWNPIDVGRLTAYVSIALYNGKITGELNEEFKAGDMGDFIVTEASDGGTEVIVGYPFKFTEENINEWSEIF